jgi:hypothetical protein
VTRCTNDAAKPQVFLQERYRDSKASGEPQPGRGHQTVTQPQAECPHQSDQIRVAERLENQKVRRYWIRPPSPLNWQTGVAIEGKAK